MPAPAILKIHEIFFSIQGEGLRAGQPAHFIRLSGCNLHCSFCDTRKARKSGKERTVTEIVNSIKDQRSRHGTDWICLTGGEPYLQAIAPLVKQLKQAGFFIQVETNATLFQESDIDWITISPKPPDYMTHPEFRSRASEVKLVETSTLNIDILSTLRSTFSAEIPLIIQTRSNRRKSAERAMSLVAEAAREGLPNIRFGVQLHRIFGFR